MGRVVDYDLKSLRDGRPDEESIRMKPYLSGDDGVKLAVTHTNAVDTGKATHPVAKVRKIRMTIGT